MKLTVFILTLICFREVVYSQNLSLEWAISYESPISGDGRSIQVDSQGNVYTTGEYRGTTDFDPGTGTSILTPIQSYDIYITKHNNAGDLLWVKTIGSEQDDFTTELAVDEEGNIYLSGRFAGMVDLDPGPGIVNYTASGSADFFVLKLDTNGNFQWANVYSGSQNEQSSALDIDSGGNIILVGAISSPTNFDTGASNLILSPLAQETFASFILKLQSDGTFLWAKSFSHLVIGIDTDKDDNLYLTGYFSGNFFDADPGPDEFILDPIDSTINDNDIFVSKLNSDGVLIWARSFGGTGNDLSLTIAVDDHSNVYTSGYASTDTDFDPDSVLTYVSETGSGSAFISKLNSDGDFVWAKHHIGSSGTSLAVNPAQDILLAGIFSEVCEFDPGPGYYPISEFGSSGAWDGFILSIDSLGQFNWVKQMGGVVTDYANSIDIDHSGNVYCTGSFQYAADFNSGYASDMLYAQGGGGGQNTFVIKLGVCPGSSGNFTQIADNGDSTLQASNAYGYRWYNCTTEKLIPGQYSSTFSPTSNGWYAGVGEDENGCYDTTACILVNYFPIEDSTDNTGSALALEDIYPNPTNDLVTISFDGTKANYTIYDAQGKLIQTSTIVSGGTVSLKDVQSGVYFFELTTDNGRTVKRVVKN